MIVSRAVSRALLGHAVGIDPFRIFILGAGFSKPAGYPLANELWPMVSERAKSLTGRASKLQDDVRAYLEYRRNCDGVDFTEDDIDF